MFLAKVKAELSQLKNKAHVDQNIWQLFWQKVNSGSPLTKTERNPEHLCSFFLPVHKNSGSIYLVDHIKGKDWMPPGGHLEPAEMPLTTVLREYQEELGKKIRNQPVQLFNLTIKSINNYPRKYCTKHYDFWYLVWTDKQHDFQWDNSEFHAAGWFDIKTGISKIKDNPDYKQALLSLYREYI